MTTLHRDPITGRFIKAPVEKPMHIKTAGVDVILSEGKEKKTLKKEKDAIVTILQANYGIMNVKIEVDPNNVKVGRKVSNKMAGSDPAPKQKKTMSVLAVVKGETVEKEFNEGDVIAF